MTPFQVQVQAAYSTDIANALRILSEALEDQVHRDGMPAMLHSLRVAVTQKTPDRIIVGLLHDVIEDGGTEWEPRIKAEFGAEIAHKVSLLTRREGENYMEYIARVCNDVDCMFVKMADIEDNMHPSRSDEKARNKAVMYGQAHDMIVKHLYSQGKL